MKSISYQWCLSLLVALSCLAFSASSQAGCKVVGGYWHNGYITVDSVYVVKDMVTTDQLLRSVNGSLDIMIDVVTGMQVIKFAIK